MSTGGNVPTQGATADALSAIKQEQLAQEKRRGPAGKPGKGTPGSRLKSRHDGKTSLKELARKAAKDKDSPLHEDAKAWIASKRSRGDDDQRKAMKEAKRRKRAKPRKSSKDRRRAK